MCCGWLRWMCGWSLVNTKHLKAGPGRTVYDGDQVVVTGSNGDVLTCAIVAANVRVGAGRQQRAHDVLSANARCKVQACLPRPAHIT